MELKTARLTLLIDPAKKAAFERLCALQDQTPSQVVRQLIRDNAFLDDFLAAFPPGRLLVFCDEDAPIHNPVEALKGAVR